MNKTELKRRIEKLISEGYNVNGFSLDSEIIDSHYILEHNKKIFTKDEWIFYYTERGHKINPETFNYPRPIRVFYSEEEACEYVYSFVIWYIESAKITDLISLDFARVVWKSDAYIKNVAENLQSIDTLRAECYETERWGDRCDILTNGKIMFKIGNLNKTPFAYISKHLEQPEWYPLKSVLPLIKRHKDTIDDDYWQIAYDIKQTEELFSDEKYAHTKELIKQ